MPLQKKQLSDVQFAALLQKQIDELQSLINNDALNVLNKDSYRQHIEVDVVSNHEVVASFIEFIHMEHPSVINEFIDYYNS